MPGPFRADHVGSLLRPPALLAAREQHAAGTLDDAGPCAAEDNAILDAAAMQEEVGLRSATDGELRRTSWHTDFIHRLGGISRTDQQIEVKMRNAGEGAFTRAGTAVDAPVRLEHPIFADHFAFLAEQAVDGLFCEFDDERSGGFEPLRFVPPGKQVVLELVTTRTGALEDPDALERCIDEAATHVPLDQLCLSPQCGFSSTVEGNALTVDEQRAELGLIVAVAADVRG